LRKQRPPHSAETGGKLEREEKNVLDPYCDSVQLLDVSLSVGARLCFLLQIYYR